MAREITFKKDVRKDSATKNKKMQIWYGIIGILLGLVLVGGATWWIIKPSLRDAPDKSDPKKVAAYLASEQFNRLSMDDKKSYVKQVSGDQPPWQIMRNAGNLPQDEREKLRNNMQPVMQQVFKERLNNFFKMSKEEQDKELDKILSQMRQGGFRGMFGGGGGGGGQRNNNSSAQPAANASTQPATTTAPSQPQASNNRALRRKERFETVDSNTRAQGVEFGKMMMAKMQQQRQTTPARSSAPAPSTPAR